MALDQTGRSYRKKLPPTPVASSLEGLEIGIPPVKFTNPWLSKPLPKIPDRASSVYSRESIINSYLDQPDPLDRCHPCQYRKPQPSPHSRQSRRLGRRKISDVTRNSLNRMSDQANRCSLTMRTFLSEEQYGVGMHLAKANHYFREKKWEIFPELGPQAATRTGQAHGKQNLKRKRILGGSHIRQISSCENFGLSLKPIADYMQQTFVDKTTRLRPKKKSGRSTSRPRDTSPSPYRAGVLSVAEDAENAEAQLSIAAVRRRMREMSIWTRADSSEETLRYDNNEFSSPTTATNSTWRSPVSRFDTSSSTTLNSRGGDRSMHYDDMSPSEQSTPSREENRSQPSHASLPGYAKTIQRKTSHVLLVIDGAKKKITEARAARRRKQLKKDIRVIGPIENYPYGSAGDWV